MADERVIPAVPENFEYIPPTPPQVQYLDQAGNITTTPVIQTTSGGGTLGSSSFNDTFQISTLQNFSLLDLVQMFVVYAFIIAAALSALFIFIGGISFILSGGNDEKIKQAVNTIRYSIIGLIVTILSFTFVTIIGRMFGLNFMDYLSYQQIKNSINQLIAPTTQTSQNFEIQG